MNLWGYELELGSIADCATALFAICAFILSIIEYRKYKKRERVNLLMQMSKKYTTDSAIKTVLSYLEALENKREKTLALPNIHQLEMFMRFFEELCCLVKSKALRVNIVYYMFGHYVIIFDDNKEIWPHELEYEKGYWKLFRNFVEMMRKSRDELFPYRNDDNIMIEDKINDKKIKL